MSSRKKARGYTPLQPENEPEWFDVSEEEIFGGPRRGDKRSIQLCRQVEEAISCALVCSTNPILRDLYVMGVEPVRGAALLRVLVTTEGEANDYQQTIEALARAKGYFRGEVARSIHRKRVPSLDFVVVASDGAKCSEIRDE
jgi:ribosome-binding factor A